MRRLLLLLPLVAFLSVACSGGGERRADVAYSAFRPIDPDGWRYTDTLVFPLAEMADSTPVCGDLAVTVRHSNDYAYSNIWLQVLTPDGPQSVCIELADVFGRWYGRGMGLTFERTDTVLRGLTLAPGDTLRIHHNMRLDTLRSVEQLGVFFLRR